MRYLRLGMVQINCTVGDLEGNTTRIKQFIDEARNLQVDVVAFPELAITGYPPEDLLLKPQFIKDCHTYLEEIVSYSHDIAVVVGLIDAGKNLYNAAAVICNGKLAGIYHKMYLPNYGVFDEYRYFQVGTECPVFCINGIIMGINICEDIWYPDGPAAFQAQAGAGIIININASPYHAGKQDFRKRMLATRALDNEVIVCYVNMVGGQDELIFDGGSLAFDERGELIAEGKQFEEDLVVVDVDMEKVLHSRLHSPMHRRGMPVPQRVSPPVSYIMVSEAVSTTPKRPLPLRKAQSYDSIGEVYAALVLGTHDYVHKNRFEKVVIGLSGGIDSSLVAAIAVDALGAENVIGVAMPSQYSSPGSKADADVLAHNLGIRLLILPIQGVFKSYLNTLADAFQDTQTGVAEENIQARIRGNLLMALSNKFGWLVLTTGNKSEIAVGYATLYGDMAGGFAVIKDVPKTLVYQLSRHKNSSVGKEIIPRVVIDKEPSAELRPDQRDTDSLPPYDILDPILEAYVERDNSMQYIADMGFERVIVEKMIEMVDRNEYKRRQSAPGIKITPRAFGKDRRLPITNRYKSL